MFKIALCSLQQHDKQSFSCMSNAPIMKLDDVIFTLCRYLLFVVHEWNTCNCEADALFHWEPGQLVSWKKQQKKVLFTSCFS